MTYPVLALGELVVARPGSRNPTTGGSATFAYIDLESVDRATKTIATPKVTVSSEAPSRARKVVKANDVLVAMVRPNLNAVAMVPPELNDEIASTGFCVLRATERVLPEFLYFAVRSQKFIDNLCGLVSGALYPAVTERQVLNQRIPVPPITDQRRIVDLLSRAENIVRMRREAEAKAKEIVPALFVDMFGDPGKNPKGWDVGRVEHLCSYTRYGPRFPDREYDPGGAHILRTTDMDAFGTIRWWEAPTLALAASEIEKYALRPPVVLVTRSGTIGRVALFTGASEPCVAGAYLIEVGLKDDVYPEYVLHFLLSDFGQKALIGGARGVAQVNLNAPTIQRIQIPLPPLPLQKKFVEHIAACLDLSKALSKASAAADSTLQSLLVGVFGEGST